jgi:hypothetical protein
MRSALVVLFLLTGVASAHDRDHPEVNAWLQHLHSKNGVPCCNGQDTIPAEIVYDTDTGKYRARIENPDDHTWDWYDVPDYALVEVPNKLGYSAAWYYWDIDINGKKTPKIRCFLPGAGG